MGVEINFSDLNKLKRLANTLENPEKIFKDIADLELSQTLIRYRKEEDPQGKGWQATVRSIREGGRILVDTGVMFNSIGRRFSKEFAVVGTNIEYAEFHQYGTKNITAREFLGINRKTEKNVVKVIDKYWKESLR